MTFTRFLLAPGLAFATMLGAAAATDWPANIEACADAAESEGLISFVEYEALFDGGTTRRFTVEIVPASDDDSVFIQCKIARGQIVSVALD